MRYRLRTLLIFLALTPPVLAWYVWPALDGIINPPSKLDFELHPPFPPGDTDDGVMTLNAAAVGT
jgi:hypothetical protein